MKLRKILLIILLSIFIINNLSFVYATEDINEDNVIEEQENGMKIYSEAAILIEQKTGKILYEKNIHERKYPASTTKILTAILAIENCDLNEKAIASQNAIDLLEDGYTKADIQPGEEFTIDELISVMMIQSANEAANIIAEHISGSVSEFSKLMNKKAKEIGCINSNFVNPNGMHNENHYSTAYDLAMIARYCMNNKKFREYAVLKEFSLPWTEYWQEEQVEEHGDRIFYNTNSMMQKNSKFYYPTCIGIKAGFTTPAKNCLISASNKNGFEVISVILHAEMTDEEESARYVDTINLFNYGYDNYKLKDIFEEYNLEEKEIEEILDNRDTGILGIWEEQFTDDDGFKIDINIIKIIIGVICIIIGIMIFGKRKRGRHEAVNSMYKFDL